MKGNYLDLQVRANHIRQRILNTIYNAKVGHIGGSFSSVEIMVALYFDIMKIKEDDPKCPSRDFFILSKGHGASALYATLVERGLISNEDELVSGFGCINSDFQVHPDMHLLDWVEISTGALGQGLSVGVGVTLGDRIRKIEWPRKVYVLLGDGECQEGQVWEAAMSASHYGLSNLIAIIDYNEGQLFGPTEEIMNVYPLAEKWESFGWKVFQANGHNIEEMINALTMAGQVDDKPSVIIASTKKGHGVSFMEQGGYKWHGKVPSDDDYELALKELKQKEQEYE